MIKLISSAIVVLFFWMIYPYKWIRYAKFLIDKRNAIIKADVMAADTKKAVYVVQYGRKFHVGLRSNFRSKNSKIVSHLKKRDEGVS